MPIHDWTRVRANRFHNFHQGWTVSIAATLNAGQLPDGNYAMIESKTHLHEADVGLLRRNLRLAAPSEAARYAQKANRVTIRRPNHALVAVLEFVSPGNKDSTVALDGFVLAAVEILRAGVHLMVVDLFPPTANDPQGMPHAIWDLLHGQPITLPPDKPLTAAAYAAGTKINAYVEPLAVGDRLPEMPIFLTADRYVLCPLETTYVTAWSQIPPPLRGPLESP